MIPRDTPLKIEEIQINLIRQSNIPNRIAIVQALTEITVRMSKKAILRANPQLSGQEINFLFCSFTYGENLANKIKEYVGQKI
ncbi:MAG: hypothetical protein ACFFDN_48655 [Candidatus Hodarchaeota archaeon]